MNTGQEASCILLSANMCLIAVRWTSIKVPTCCVVPKELVLLLLQLLRKGEPLDLPRRAIQVQQAGDDIGVVISKALHGGRALQERAQQPLSLLIPQVCPHKAGNALGFCT